MTTSNNVIALPAIAGKGASARLAACKDIATQAYAAESGKASFVAMLTLVLGVAPSDELTAFARLETIIGVAAMRMPNKEVPSTLESVADRLAFIRDLVLNYQAPSKAVSGKVPALRKGKSGWRSAIQQRIIRNAEDRASKYLAETGAGEAKSEATKNAEKAKRAAQMPGEGGESVPNHTQLVAPEKAVDAADYVSHMQLQLSALLAYDNKNAGVRPITHSAFADALVALRTLGNAAANEFALSQVEPIAA
jgi:hypothetical protein